MSSVLEELPSPTPANSAGFFKRVRGLKAKPQKVTLPVVEVKKAMKLLRGQGKSVAEIVVLAGGGFRVIASAKNTTEAVDQASNPWDDVL